MNICTDPTDPRPITVVEVLYALRAAGLDLRATAGGLVLRRREPPPQCAVPKRAQPVAISDGRRSYCDTNAVTIIGGATC